MKFTLISTNEDDKTLAENHDKDHINSLDEAVEWSKEQIEYFNDTLRPHEKERTYIATIGGHFARGINAGVMTISDILKRKPYEERLEREHEAIQAGERSIAILEGESPQDDHIELLEDYGFEVHVLDGLYFQPQDLRKLPEIDPDYIYIFTTGTMVGNRASWRENLKREFSYMDWIPDNVIFFNDTSAQTYAKTAKKLKQYGTDFYKFPSYIDPKLKPIKI